VGQDGNLRSTRTTAPPLTGTPGLTSPIESPGATVRGHQEMPDRRSAFKQTASAPPSAADQLSAWHRPSLLA
jgi:hypothetical protein